MGEYNFLQGVIDSARSYTQELAGEFTFMQTISLAIVSIAFIVAVLDIVLPALARNEPIDFWGLFRPVIVGLVVVSFHVTVAAPLLRLSSAMTNLSGTYVTQSADRLSDKMGSDWAKKSETYKDMSFMERIIYTTSPEAKKIWDEKAATGADMSTFELEDPDFSIINTISNLYSVVPQVIGKVLVGLLFFLSDIVEYIFYAGLIVWQQICLLILCLVGPLAFAFSIFPMFRSGLSVWLSKFINVGLWGFIANILRVFNNYLRTTIDTSNTVLDFSGGWSGALESIMTSLLFLLVAFMFLYVPTLSDMIVNGAGGLGGISGAPKSVLNKASKLIGKK